MVKKILKWGGIAFLLFYIVNSPDDAAAVGRTLGGEIQNIAIGLGTFATNVVS